MSVLTQIIKSVALTIIICLAEDSEALRRSKPDIYQKFVSTFPSLPLWSQAIHNDTVYYVTQAPASNNPPNQPYQSQQPVFGGPSSGYPPQNQSYGYPPQPTQGTSYGYPPQTIQSSSYAYPPQPPQQTQQGSAYGYPPQSSYPPPPRY